MHCLIIDNVETSCLALDKLLQAEKSVSSVHIARNANEVKRFLTYDIVEVVFIRVKLWDYRLFEGVKQMPSFIFLSSVKEKYKEDLQDEVTYHLREPYQKERVRYILKGIETEQKSDASDFMFLKYEWRYQKIEFDSIELIERKPGNYVLIYTNKHQFMVAGTLNSWLEKLPEDRFTRLSDTLIVPKDELYKVEGGSFKFRGREIRLTFRYQSAAKELALFPML